MRALAALAVLANVGYLASCAFAVKHPAATVAIAGGVVAGTTCEIGTDFAGEHATCGVVTVGSAAVLGGIVLLATLLGGEGNTVLYADDEPATPVPQDPTLDAPAPTPGSPPPSQAPSQTPPLPPQAPAPSPSPDATPPATP